MFKSTTDFFFKASEIHFQLREPWNILEQLEWLKQKHFDLDAGFIMAYSLKNYLFFFLSISLFICFFCKKVKGAWTPWFPWFHPPYLVLIIVINLATNWV